jgi:hypothetical protein
MAGVMNEREEKVELTTLAGYPQTVKEFMDPCAKDEAKPEPSRVVKVPPPAPATETEADSKTRGTVKKTLLDLASPIVPTRTRGTCFPDGESPRTHVICVFVHVVTEQDAAPIVIALPELIASPNRVPVITIVCPFVAIVGDIERRVGVLDVPYKYVPLENNVDAILDESDESRTCTVIDKGVVFELAGVLTISVVVVAETTVHMAVSRRTTFLLKFIEKPTPVTISKWPPAVDPPNVVALTTSVAGIILVKESGFE